MQHDAYRPRGRWPTWAPAAVVVGLVVFGLAGANGALTSYGASHGMVSHSSSYSGSTITNDKPPTWSRLSLKDMRGPKAEPFRDALWIYSHTIDEEQRGMTFAFVPSEDHRGQYGLHLRDRTEDGLAFYMSSREATLVCPIGGGAEIVARFDGGPPERFPCDAGESITGAPFIGGERRFLTRLRASDSVTIEAPVVGGVIRATFPVKGFEL
jgi:hypothetical protein